VGSISVCGLPKTAKPADAPREEVPDNIERGLPAKLATGEGTVTEDDAERVNNHYLKVSSVSLGLAVAGALVFPPLSLASSVLFLYLCVPRMKSAYQAVFEERRVRASVIDSIGFVTALGAGQIVLSAVSTTIFFISRKILLKTEDRSRHNLLDIFGEQPRTVLVLYQGAEVELAVEQLQAGDVVVVNAGNPVPVDGVVREGSALVDQHMLTGESQPVEKSPGDKILAATLVLRGRVCVEVEKTGAQTVAAQIAGILARTADYRSEVESRGERLADDAALPTLGLAGLALLAVGPRGAVATLNSIYVDNMRIAAPVGVMNFLDKATAHSILVKDGRALDLLHEVDTILFDKTGTLTAEQPHVGDIYTCQDFSPETLLSYAAAAEAKQTHPIARAIQQGAAERSLEIPAFVNARYHAGRGIQAEVDDKQILVGSARLMSAEGVTIPEAIVRRQEKAHESGATVIFVAVGGALAGAIELRPTLRPEVPELIRALRDRGLHIYIISGDHEAPTRHLAATLGIESYFAEVLPSDKAALVEKLRSEGRKVCFVGDGINDAIALKKSNASISLSGATTIATDTAQVVLMDGSLRRIPFLFDLAKDFDSNVRRGVIINVVSSALAIGGVLFMNFGVASSLLLYNASLLLSVGNAHLPALRGKAAPERTALEKAAPEE
jgi:heavy metal translocating P-type ATPase